MTLRAHVRVRRGGFQLDAAVTAGDGEVVAILGPNGSGKSMLLRTLAGLLRADGGQVELDGVMLEDAQSGRWVPPEERPAAMMFQDSRLFPHLTAVDNVGFGLRSRRMRRTAAHDLAREWLDRLDVIEVADRRPAEMSGGQAQRVALARALIVEPRLLLLDEPLASVDASAAHALRGVLRAQLVRRPGMHLLVTHDPVEAGALADRVLILEAGRVTQQGTMAEITARPRSPWAARVAGVNLFRGAAETDSFRCDGGAAIKVAAQFRGPALASIHPRSVSLHRERPTGSQRNVVSGRVADVDCEQDRRRIRLEGDVALVAEVTAGAVAELQLGVGVNVFAAFKATDVDVYPM